MPTANAAALEPTNTKWTTDFDTARREKLFRNPPKDHTAYPELAAATRPHIDSFNAVFERGGLLDLGIKDIGTKTFLDGEPGSTGPRNRLSFRIREYFFEKAQLPPTNKYSTRNRDIYPSECRERHATYRGKLTVRVEVRLNGGDWREYVRDMGYLPIMLKSNKCHLENLPPAELIRRKEESDEFGGYFLVNGLEKLVRLLIVTKRNFPMAIIRPSYENRGPSYSKYGVQIRSVRPDQSSQTNVLHYLNDGNVTFRFSWRKNEYLVPVMMILRALAETNDREIFEGIVGNAKSKTLSQKQFVIDRVEMLLRTFKVFQMYGKARSRAYLGARFKPVLGVPEDMADEDVGTEFLRKIVLPHLGASNVTEVQDMDKFRMLLFMTRKLYALAEGECAVDNPDAVSNQEILLGGFLYGMILKEQLEEWLNSFRIPLLAWMRSAGGGRSFSDPEFWQKFPADILQKNYVNIGQKLDYFLATGNVSSPSGLDLQQTSGFTIVAEKLNFYRFISHFRCVHRGSFFAQLKTTTVRKLLPESWGFLCPVHTPDGSPCGLLNHLAHKCLISTKPLDTKALPGLLAGFGVTAACQPTLEESVVVQLDGRVLGYCSPKQARVIGDTLRYWKVEGTHGVPRELEVGYVPNSNGGQYPGVYIFAHPARMYRPVKYLPLDGLDYVGPFEQTYMSIAVTPPEITSGENTHVEFAPTNILSIIANMTPFSDFNQSPRNMYQCQMGKQSMGTYATALSARTDNKSYRLQCGQTPVVRPALHNTYGFDNFPNGTNAVVAVIAYTGYDMDDAMIINKSAHERGFGYGSIYKTKKLDLEEDSRRQGRSSVRSVTHLYGFPPGSYVKAEWRNRLDDDGLPRVGLECREGDIIAAYYEVQFDPRTSRLEPRDGRVQFHRYKDQEQAFVEEVRVLGSEEGNTPLHAVSIKFRIPRSPVIGDKFSSRHGQKGVCSQKWPTVDMPFSESGIVPDVIINPHAFPSRMTIGMFVESMAGKAGTLHGFAQDATPWTFADRKGATAVEHFGEQLRAAGYNYYGNEPMYSGITGEELAADIYVGVVYYQRLRHMVNDKFQVRTTGPINQLTGQPVKGRSKGGGIRVGEMERDSLLAHGTAFLLQDRLLNCSDYTKTWVCRACGGFLSTQPTVSGYGKKRKTTGVVRCRRCSRPATGLEPKTKIWEDGQGEKWVGGEDVTVVAVPGVLKYLDVELSAMGVRMKFTITP